MEAHQGAVVGNQALARGRPNMLTQKMLIEKMRSCLQALANNLQQSWRFDWEPPKAVLRDAGMINWIWGG